MRLISTFALCFLTVYGISQNDHPLITSGKVHPRTEIVQEESRAAACAPATALRDLEWNNISALIETGGSLWQDRAVGLSHYYAPKDGNVSVLYAGALWLGGLSPDQQLKLAAITYRFGGNDFWSGPLSNDGSAEISESECVKWDRFTITYRADAQRHRQYFECINSADCVVEESFPSGYSIPPYFFDYPAIGNTSAGQDLYLAPFYDFDGDGSYNPENGDYPWYDFLKEINCAERKRDDIVPLFGDQNYYWIFNDKGNIHSESGAQPIGMEIRAQAFAFSTNDEVNNMTFYNYVLINQGSQTLQDTYFGTWIDLDIGGHVDDFVGCDVQRGLGYGYNGPAVDSPTGLSPGYGEYPPAVGVDFFEGPYQDADGVDNPLTDDILEAIDLKGIPYKGIGIGYGDGVIDNERFGMRKFLYHVSGSSANGTPEFPIHFYNYMRGYWRNGQRMSYGGNALNTGTNQDISADYMFPGNSDPLHWGTLGTVVDAWDEVSAGNIASDRRFMQSAGPFTLEPGDYNNITVGVVYARASQGNPFESVKLVLSADDKAQALFDNCFELISGPDAPDVAVQELNKEVILYLNNEDFQSSNYREGYSLIDPTIPEFNTTGEPLTEEQRSYSFQGYMIYQLSGSNVSSGELNDVTKARLIAQCDIQDEVENIINYNKDESTQETVPSLMVSGSNSGLQHTFRVTTDAFAQGDNKLVNHKTYYFMAIAYGYNNYEEFNINLGSGQDQAFLSSRKATFGPIQVISAIPHIVTPEAGGTILYSAYGTEIALTQHEGKGNGEQYIRLTENTEESILNENVVEDIQYLAGNSPVKVMVVDPLRVPSANFELRLSNGEEDIDADNSFWVLINLDNNETYSSIRSIDLLTEELVMQWGLSVSWYQYMYSVDEAHFIEPVGSSIQYESPDQPWLRGFADDDSDSPFNWIRAGYSILDDLEATEFETLYNDYKDGDANPMAGGNFPTDARELYESMVDGTWSPYCLVSSSTYIDELLMWMNNVAPTSSKLRGDLSPFQIKFVSNIKGLNNVDVVYTDNKQLWTRCPVLEMQSNAALSEGNADKMQLRKSPSVDKNGRMSGTQGCNENEATSNGTQPAGMGWFPGYAIDISTGERLNMAFGEDSWMVGENGRDMIWNPTSRVLTDLGNDFLCGGQHWIYIFKNLRHLMSGDEDYMPAYDSGNYVYSLLNNQGNIAAAHLKNLFASCTWVGSALLNSQYELKSPEDGLIPNDVRIELRVSRPYEKHSTSIPDDNPWDFTGAENAWNPYYTFNTFGLEASINSSAALNETLDLINIVPNPYYAFSTYEANKVDNRVKITNLPQVCTISIYNLTGTLIRQFEKADPITSLDWDLKNNKNIPIASGTYIIHIDVPGAGEKILKWFGVMRPVDLDNF